MSFLDEGENYKGIHERTQEEIKRGIEEGLEELKIQNKLMFNALKFIQSLAKNPNHRTARTLLQMCSFLDDIVLPTIEPIIKQVEGDQS